VGGVVEDGAALAWSTPTMWLFLSRPRDMKSMPAPHAGGLHGKWKFMAGGGSWSSSITVATAADLSGRVG
jgi:hypothetical protein